MDSSCFQRGTKVTICSDAEGQRPRRIGFVKRLGVGAWRLAGCSEWYDFNGVRMCVDGDKLFSYVNTTCFARPYREGDEDAIIVENARVNERELLNRQKAESMHRIKRIRESAATDKFSCEKEILSEEKAVAMAEANLASAKNYLARSQKKLANLSERKKDGEADILRHEADIESFNERLKRLD